MKEIRPDQRLNKRILEDSKDGVTREQIKEIRL